MSEEPIKPATPAPEDKPRSRHGRRLPNFAPVTDITPEMAFDLYTSLPDEDRHHSGLWRLLQSKGFKISRTTIFRWAIKHGWDKAMTTPRYASANTVLSMMAILRGEAAVLTSETYQGVQARFIARLAEAVAKVDVRTPDDLEKLINCADKLRALVHDARGDAIGKSPQLAEIKDRAVSDANGRVVVGLGEFTKPRAFNGKGSVG